MEKRSNRYSGNIISALPKLYDADLREISLMQDISMYPVVDKIAQDMVYL